MKWLWVEVDTSSADEDLSDLTALVNPTASTDKSKENEPAPSFEAPDMSALLNPVVTETASDDAGMPDLSMFDEPEEEPEEIIEEEPEEVSIADMGLDALLAGGGFDEPEETPAEEESSEDAEPEIDLDNFEDIPDLDDIGTQPEPEPETIPEAEPEALDDAEPLEEPEALDDIAPLDEPEALGEPEALDDMEPLEEPQSDSIEEAAPQEDFSDALPAGDFDFDMPDLPETDSSETASESESEALPADDFDSLPPDNFDEDEPEAFESETPAAETSSSDGLESFDLPDISDVADTDITEPAADSITEDTVSEESSSNGSIGLEELGNLDFDAPDNAAAAEETSEEDSGIPAGLFDAGDFDLAGDTGSSSTEFSAEDEIPDFDDTAGLDDETSDSETEGEENTPLEVFDTSEMEGMDFGIQDTDSQISAGGDGDFEFGSHDDFAMEGEFEIPGFSDVTTAKEEKGSKTKLVSSKDKPKGRGRRAKDLPVADFSGAEEAEELPPNTLSDEQYKIFLANLAEYPLNVRLAFEDFIVQDEFTDDAEFEIIEKILNKAPARQVAGMLEKMLDTSIPIPRDFEHRTAAEYEAYKKSLSYQLRNKIIPGILLGLLLTIVGWGLIKFTDYCIYRPIKANSLYKQGYALLQADEYPQAEMRFEEAVKKRINKKWFFRYARGYRDGSKKQPLLTLRSKGYIAVKLFSAGCSVRLSQRKPARFRRSQRDLSSRP